MNILFVCSRNQWRSPTAEAVYRNRKDINVKSAGTSSSAKNKLTAKIILWSDIIFVMEKKHKQIMMESFPDALEEKKIIILDIPDEYQFMDSELIEEIETKVNSILTNSII